MLVQLMCSHYYMVLSVLGSHISSLLTTLTHWIIFPCLEHFVHLAFRTTRFLVFLLLSLAIIFIGFGSSLQLPRWWIEDSTFSTYICFFGRLIPSQYIKLYLYFDEYHISVSSPNRTSDPRQSSELLIFILKHSSPVVFLKAANGQFYLLDAQAKALEMILAVCASFTVYSDPS